MLQNVKQKYCILNIYQLFVCNLIKNVIKSRSELRRENSNPSGEPSNI